MKAGAAIPFEAEQTLRVLARHVPDSLLGVYLHGSAVAGGLAPYSDVDVLAVVDRPTPHAVRASLARALLRISGRPGSDAVRPVELIVFQRADLEAAAYPARGEFIYGEWLREGVESGKAPGPVSDPELTLLLAQARHEASALFGPPADELLPAIPHAEIVRAIGDALPALLDTLEGDERNVLLTLARMWRTAATGEFVPKHVAADWAVARLPAEAAALMNCARDEYLGETAVHWPARREEVRSVTDELRGRVVAML